MSAAQYFATEMKIAREAQGWTQGQLATEIKYSESLVAMVEANRRYPSKDFCSSLDKVFDSNGRFERMRQSLLVPESSPEWFRPWLSFEAEATAIRLYEPLLVPGLLQTEGYARALLGDDERVASRLSRQQLLERATVTVVIEEGVLRRPVGDAEVMRQQLVHLTETTACV